MIELGRYNCRLCFFFFFVLSRLGKVQKYFVTDNAYVLSIGTFNRFAVLLDTCRKYGLATVPENGTTIRHRTVCASV